MNFEFPYDYVTLYLFRYLWNYERKNSVTKEELKNLHKIIINNLINSYQDPKEFICNDGDVYNISFDINFNSYDENKELNRFLSKYNCFFYSFDDTVYLNSNIDWYKYTFEVSKLNNGNCIIDRINLLFEDTKLLRSLGIHSVEDLLKKYMKVEQELEKYYYDLCTLDNLEEIENKINLNLLKRSIFMQNISSLKNDFKYPFLDMAGIISRESDGRGFFAIQGYEWSWSREEKLYFHKTLSVISDAIANHSIGLDFDGKSLSTTSKSLLYDRDYGFCLLYLDKLNKYMEEYGATDFLLNVKSRLLYFLDRNDLMIYKPENFDKLLQEYKNISFDLKKCETSDYVLAHSSLLVDNSELVNGKLPDANIIYAIYFAVNNELTNDGKIKEMLGNYSDIESYDLLKNIIIGSCEKNKIKIVKQ